MPSFAGFARNAFRAGFYEAQDVLVECDDVDLIPLKPRWQFARKSKWMNRLVYHDVTRTLVNCNPGFEPVRLKSDYDLFIAVCAWWRDVWNVNAIQDWRDHCRTSVCWIDELWSHNLASLKYWLPILRKFDHIIIGTSGSAKYLSEMLGRPCHEVQGGVDTIRFSPYPNPPERVVEFYNVGRKSERIHNRLLQWAQNENHFYMHDTLENSGNRQTIDYRQHRDQYANVAKRSCFFGVAPGKVDSAKERGGQASLGLRYFEGSAAGAVLVGQSPDCEAFRQHFDWPEAVVEAKPDGSDIIEVLSRITADSDQLHEMSSRNAEQALRRHDWVYRWKDILGIAGLTPRPAMECREKRLTELADIARLSRNIA